jgi:hypothetical protein
MPPSCDELISFHKAGIYISARIYSIYKLALIEIDIVIDNEYVWCSLYLSVPDSCNVFCDDNLSSLSALCVPVCSSVEMCYHKDTVAPGLGQVGTRTNIVCSFVWISITSTHEQTNRHLVSCTQTNNKSRLFVFTSCM